MKYSLAFILLIYFLFQQAYAGDNRVSLIKQVNQCASISLDKKRLACFDNLTKKEQIKTTVVVKKVKEKSKIKPALVQKTSEKIVQSVTTPLKTQVDNFSKIHIKKTKEERDNELISIRLTISKLKKLLRGQWVIYFTNGQKWQQKDNVKLKLKVDDQVTLNKGMLNAVYLKKAGNNRTIRVKRIK